MSVIVAKPSERGRKAARDPYSITAYPAVTAHASVSVSSTVSIDGVSTSAFRAAKWYVVVINGAGTRSESYEVFATHHNGANPVCNRYAMIGDSLNVATSVAIVGGKLTLQMTNADSETFNVYVTRTAIPLSTSVANTNTVIEIGNAHAIVPAGTTDAIDFVNAVTTLGIKWIVTATDSTGNKSTEQILALMNPAEGTESIYGRIGSGGVNYVLGINELAGMGTELTLHNSGLADLKVDVTRIPILSAPMVPTIGAVSGLALWLPVPVTIPAGRTVVVDNQVAVPAHSAVKWLVGINESAAGTTMVGELLTNYQLGSSTTSDLWYSLLGDSLSIVVSTALVGGNIVLSITNNEPNPITINLLRIPTSM